MDTEGESRLQYFQEALKAALEEARSNSRLAYGEDFMVQTCEKIKFLRGDGDDSAFAFQLQHLHSRYFSNRKISQQFASKDFIKLLARKVNHVHRCDRLWPEGSWLSKHTPNPSWLTDEEIFNISGCQAAEYKNILRAIGYAPVAAPSKDALDETWDALYNPAKASMSPPTSNTERYAVVSYVQCAGGKKPPATWTSEVDSVLTALVSLGIITDKAVWFDKLASRQYSDSQKWWGAAATMQFVFNPVIVLLPRVSEQQSFVPTIGQTIWGSDEADKIFQDFLKHVNNCTDCCTSYQLRWALQHDHVLPIAALRTWPRVEHALGASGLGLFTSETTDAALTALLTCAFAMFSVLCKNDRGLHKMLCDAELFPSTFIAEDDTILIGWVAISCSNWRHQSSSVDRIAPPLEVIASCMMELYDLFCKFQTPKHLALQQTLLDERAEQYMFHEFKEAIKQEFCKLPCGLYYPESHMPTCGDDTGNQCQVDVPTLARFNSNDKIKVHAHYSLGMPMAAFAFSQVYWASANIHRNLKKSTVPAEHINNAHFLHARHEALTTLVHSRAAQAPCYAWDDKLVAAILLSSPRVFLDAFRIWEDQKNGGHMLTRLNKALNVAGVLAEEEDVEWEPNTLIVALAVQTNQTVHRLVPRPVLAWDDFPVHVAPLATETNTSAMPKCFAGYFLGHLPMKVVEALRYRTTGGRELPQMNDWVYRNLQNASLLDTNMIVVRQPWRESTEHQQAAGQCCWHCQKLEGAGFERPGSSRAPKMSIPPFDCEHDDPFMADVTWGLGSFDPLSFAAFLNPYYHFGRAPDCVAVLLRRSESYSTGLHAHALAHFAILGSERVRTCTSCYALIVEEWDRNLGADCQLLALWSLLPLKHNLGRGEIFNGVGIIRG